MNNCLKGLLCLFFSLLILDCVRTGEVITEAAAEPEIKQGPESKIIEIREKIIQNIVNSNDIDTGIDFDEINSLMKYYELRPNSCVVKIDDKPYDLRIMEDLLYSYEIIRTNWDIIKKENIQRIVNEYVIAKNEKQYIDEYILMDAISYYIYQSEISAVFFHLLAEQFQLSSDQYDLNELPEVTVAVLPLPMTAVNIDEILFESTAVEAMQSLMRQKTEELIQNICQELTGEINTQFDICVRNVDDYLDWYYSIFTGFGRIWQMIKGAFDRNRTMGEALQEYMVKNYVEKIGNGTAFENFVIILQKYEDVIMEQAFVFGSLLGDCILEDDTSIESIQDISGDDYMAPFIALSDYLNMVVTEGLQIMGMGDKLDTDGVLLLDAASFIINLIPGVGVIAGTIVDGVTLKLTELWKRPDFKWEIISSIRNEQKKLLAVINVENQGGENEILF